MINTCHKPTRATVGRLPWVSLTIAAVALLIYGLPTCVKLLQYDRQALASGQLWRLLSWHFVHWSGDHLIWDLLTFLGLGIACELVDRRRFLWTLLAAAFAISASTWLLTPQLTVCRGLSGLDSALYGFLLFEAGQRAWCNRRILPVACIALAGAAFLTKTGIEIATGSTLFVASMGQGIVAMPLAHLTGFIVGAAGGCPTLHRSPTLFP